MSWLESPTPARRAMSATDASRPRSANSSAAAASSSSLLRAASARNGRVKLWDSRHDRDGDGLVDLRVHHKYMLISGRYGDDRSAWRVHTGSQNWGRGTLRMGDDNTVNIASRRIYRQYHANWRMVAHGGARRVGR